VCVCVCVCVYVCMCVCVCVCVCINWVWQRLTFFCPVEFLGERKEGKEKQSHEPGYCTKRANSFSWIFGQKNRGKREKRERKKSRTWILYSASEYRSCNTRPAKPITISSGGGIFFFFREGRYRERNREAQSSRNLYKQNTPKKNTHTNTRTHKTSSTRKCF